MYDRSSRKNIYKSTSLGVDILVVGQIKGSRMFLQPVIIVGNGTHEEAHRFGGIPRSPFLAGLF